jgi:hypothetical protein
MQMTWPCFRLVSFVGVFQSVGIDSIDTNGIICIAGMWLFFNVNLEQDEGAFMDDNVSYRHFDSAFFSLFRQVLLV